MEGEQTYKIGPYELTMAKKRKGFHGEYTKGDSKEVFTFSVDNMTKKQIISTFWDRVKADEKKLKKGG